LIQKPGFTWAKQKELLHTTILPDGKNLSEYWNNPSFPFRIFKSHSTPNVIKVKEFPNVKFLSMMRNGLDVVNSLVPFFSSHSDDWRNMWGGFPPAGTHNPAADREKLLNDLLPGAMLSNIYFEYVKAWWPYRHEPNVLLLHYSDAIKDLEGTVTKLAHFVGVSLSKTQHAKVTEKCGMPYMKENKHLFSIAVPLNPEYNAANKRVLVSGTLTRKGGIGEGKSIFTSEQAAKWAKAEEDQFTEPGLLEWARQGEGGATSA